MAIKVNRVANQPTQTERRVTYRDLYLDLVESDQPYNDAMYGKSTQIDLKTSSDEGAIMNSLRNIFTTNPGEKILDPTFGLSLTRWLFEPLDEFVAQEIGEAIVEGIEKFEPRVSIKNITVNMNAEHNQYDLKLVLTIPSLNIIEKSYEAILNQPGFDFLTNSTS